MGSGQNDLLGGFEMAEGMITNKITEPPGKSSGYNHGELSIAAEPLPSFIGLF